jgi:hypothetical protein
MEQNFVGVCHTTCRGWSSCRLLIADQLLTQYGSSSDHKKGHAVATCLDSDLFLAQMTVRDALNSAMDEEMDRDKDVFILGEEVCLCVDVQCWLLMLCCRSFRALPHKTSHCLSKHVHTMLLAGGGVSRGV